MKLCVYWQGRKSTDRGLRKFGVFLRCMPESKLQQAAALTKNVGGRRRGGAALLSESAGLSKTLMTCRGKRCKITSAGHKAGL